MNTTGMVLTDHAIKRYIQRFCGEVKDNNVEKREIKIKTKIMVIIAFGKRINPVYGFNKLLAHGIDTKVDYYTDLKKVVVVEGKRVVTVYQYDKSKWY